MLETVDIFEDHRNFSAGSKFNFTPGVNLLVGDQGSGKSTLLAGIMHHQRSKWLGCQVESPTDVRWMDFERTPRTEKTFRGSQEQFMPSLLSHVVSHGEFVLRLLESACNVVSKDADTLFLMDEPDMALSPRSAWKLVGIFNKLCQAPNVQILASAHNPIVIGAFPLVLNMELGTWGPPEVYLDSQRV